MIPSCTFSELKTLAVNVIDRSNLQSFVTDFDIQRFLFLIMILDTSKRRITLLLIVLIIISPFYISVDKSLYCFLFPFVLLFVYFSLLSYLPVNDVVFSFKDIVTTSPPGTRFLFDWNPCTKFNEGDGCQDVLVSK